MKCKSIQAKNFQKVRQKYLFTTTSVYFVMVIDNCLTTSGSIKLSDMPLSITVLILCPLITKYWIDVLNEYGAGPVIVAGKMSLFTTNVTVYIFCWTFDSWMSLISTKVTFFGLPWFIWLILISFTRDCIYKWRWSWVRFWAFF